MITELLNKMTGKNDIERLLALLFSPEELHSVNGRILIYKELLRAELSQREISKQHKISIATITRGSNNLKSISNTDMKLLKKLLIEE